MEKLFLIDAYALIFRFYYAFLQRPMRNAAGQNTSAVFGFVKFLNELIDRESPHHLGVAFDPKGGNFRHQLYPLYKANRSATPEDILASVPRIKEILQAMQIPILEIPGYEADDVIGTISAKASATGLYQTYMVTPDKDYGQLIRPNVSIYKPAKGADGIEIVGMDRICECYGIADPIHVIDILALWGDASDNIPGVPGIGEKGASKLVAQWGPIENILANVDLLTPKQRDSILANKEQLELSKVLATISLDVPIEFEPEKLVMEQPDYEALRQIYLREGFNMFLRELDSIQYHAVRAQSEAPKAITTKPYSKLVTVDQPTLFDQPLQVPEVDSSQQVDEKQEKDEKSEIDFETIKTISHNYIVINTQEQLRELITLIETRDRFCFDTETTGLNPLTSSLVGISICIEAHTAYWIPNQSWVLEELRPLFANEKIAKIGQNIKFDILVLTVAGVQVRGLLLDTMIIDYLLYAEGSRHSMDAMARKYLNYNPVSIESLIGKGARQLTMDRVAPHLIAEYAAEDADITMQLYNALWPKLEELGLTKLYFEIEEPLIYVLAQIEMTGVYIDPEILGESAAALNLQALEIEQQIRQIAGIETLNINSPKQLGEVLFEKLKIIDKPKLTKTKQYKTDEETLQSLSDKHPIIELILEYRGIRKLLSTYIEALPELINPRTHRVHTSFNQAVTATGRLSSTNPNLQNIPIREAAGRQIRRAFTAQQGNILIGADYSQVELRIMAHLSQDHNLLEAFRNGEDIHTATAAKIYGIETSEVTSEQRRRAKTANFGIIYGISVFGLSQRLDISRAEAKELIDGYFKLYPGVRLYMDRVIEQARERGYVETLYSRRRYLEDITSRNAIARGLAERNAINAPIQGSAADIMKLAMIRTARALEGIKARIILQVHDELLIEAPLEESEAVSIILAREMANAAQLSIDLVVEVGQGHSWLEAH